MAAPIPENPNETAEIQRANDAAFVLEQPALQQAFARLREHFEAAWRKSKIGESSKREYAFLMLKATDALEAELREVIDTGKLAVKTKETRALQKALADADPPT